jgi:hypothetical protein
MTHLANKKNRLCIAAAGGESRTREVLEETTELIIAFS